MTFNRFVRSEAFAGVLLVLFAAVAMVWANSAWSAAYFALKELPFRLSLGEATFKLSLEHWINDGLMVLFFVLVGLEIKRELLVGELRQPRQAALAIFAALGGMVVPALVFVLFNRSSEGLRGWGVPMATDIAFSLGVLALLGSRVPLALKVFLTALAIVDDLGAVMVIALFYTSNLNLTMLGLAGLMLGAAALCNLAGVRSLGAYGLIGVLLWAFTLQSGLHATVAGVMLALAVPLRVQRKPLAPHAADSPEFDKAEFDGTEGRLQSLEEEINRAQSPLYQLEHALAPWVTYLVLPVFALANAGVRLEPGVGFDSLFTSGVTAGVTLGLLVGKPVGIGLACLLAVRLGFAAMPEGVGWRALLGVALLAGIGFTMSFFVATLALEGALLAQAKIGVLGGSLAAALAGLLWLSLALRPVEAGGAVSPRAPSP